MSQADKRRGLLQQQALSKGFKVRQQELSGRQRRGWQHLLSWRSLWAGSTLRFSVRVNRQGLSGSGRPATPSLLFAPPSYSWRKKCPVLPTPGWDGGNQAPCKGSQGLVTAAFQAGAGVPPSCTSLLSLTSPTPSLCHSPAGFHLLLTQLSSAWCLRCLLSRECSWVSTEDTRAGLGRGLGDKGGPFPPPSPILFLLLLAPKVAF